MRWITVGPADQPDTSIVLHPPAADPGITDDERRTIAEMMAKGTYACITAGHQGPRRAPSSSCRPATPRSSRSRPSSRTASATAPSATPPATWSASSEVRTDAMTAIDSVILEVPDPAGRRGLLHRRLRARRPAAASARSEAPTTGFRGFTLSLVVSQPSTVDSLVGTALDGRRHDAEAGHEELLGLRRRRPGPGRDDLEGRVVVEEGHRPGHPGGRRRRAAAGRRRTSRRPSSSTSTTAWPWGRASAASTSSSTLPASPVKLALYGRRAAAKDAGVAPEGTGSHRIVIGGDAGPFTDPDGFVWEARRPEAGRDR